MSATWRGDLPDVPPISGHGLVRLVLRGTVLASVVFGGLTLLLLIRMVERPLYGARRPLTPWITQIVCRTAFRVLGMAYRSEGLPMAGPGAVVANHASWLDIFALNARKRIYFVAKDEVAGWAGIGWLARATGTVFIRRDRRDAANQREIFRTRLGAGHKLLFFPEGTSSDGRRVLPFKPTLFAAFFDPALGDLHVQPVTVIYAAPAGADPRFYSWYAGMNFAPHLAQVLAARRQGGVEVIYHTPLRVADYPNRKALAAAAEATVRAPFAARLN